MTDENVLKQLLYAMNVRLNLEQARLGSAYSEEEEAEGRGCVIPLGNKFLLGTDPVFCVLVK